ncbi:glycosyltransferase family 32 protein, partial [Conidiobolus coronatus NRRL 28638]
DLFRYSIIHKEGGLYADSDVEKASEFEDSMSKLSGCNVIVGIEADVRDRGDWWKGKMARKLQLVQWSFYSTAKHPLMEFVVDRVVRKIEQLQADGLNLHDQNVMDVTGPGIWTDSINDYIRLKSGVKIDEQMKCGSSYRYNDVCILNVKGYALSMPHSCGNETDADTFIIDIHHFLGSWK